MDINPSTAIFAIINFCVLVVGLKVFLYKPVCAMLDSRREEVANNLNSAEEAKLEAQKLKDEYAAQL
ncbi:MAG: ATP synthase F0 subunit B, partial [Peptococcaceae bacterium]|nr:ATP synthase F0 subunit B [Peptococcaceae bacterium]